MKNKWLIAIICITIVGGFVFFALLNLIGNETKKNPDDKKANEISPATKEAMSQNGYVPGYEIIQTPRQDSYGYAKITLEAQADFKIVWVKTTEEKIVYDGILSNFNCYYNIQGWDGTCGLVPTKDFLDGLKVGTREFRFYAGNTYDFYIVGFSIGPNGLIDPDDFIRYGVVYDENDYIKLKWHDDL